ncbi:MAG: 2Fe-2S iron-sulfur cluster-binding protein [Chloroflexota bacterium]
MTARRSGVPAGRTVRFTFDGRAYEGVEGESLAVALLAADRVVLSRSFRFHRARGLMCSTGQCGWCECEVDGVPSVRSCRVPVREGLAARGEHAWPSVERDLLSGVGLFSGWIPPTFYHHRFLRPRRLRKRYLDVLRWFGGRGRLPVDQRAAPAGRATHSLEADMLVVGGGRSGVAAATAAAKAGSTVILLDSNPIVTEIPGVRVLAATTAIGWYDGMVAALGDGAAYEIRASNVVAATGSYDRVPLVPGADRPGVLAARTVIGLIDRDGRGVLPGRTALLVGSGQELATAAERLGRGGISGTYGPVRTNELLAVHGRHRVTGATTGIKRSRRRVSVDLVVFGDRSPNLDLVLAAGAAVERDGDTLVPVLDADGRTTVAGLSVVGSATGRSGMHPEPDHAKHEAAHRDAMVCFCEDVRVHEVASELTAGYSDPELVKRRTGALTGPCQGKQCLQAFACLTGTASVPTARPPLRPVRLGDLVPPQ